MIERVKKIIAHTGLSDRAFSIRCGINQPTLFNQLKGLRNISLDTVRAIVKTYPEISCDWLLTGAGTMLRTDTSSKELDRINKLVDTIATLQDTINEKNATIQLLTEEIEQLKAQLKLSGK